MEFLSNGLTLELPAGIFPLSTDSMLLAHFARLPKNARVLDLGSGGGTLGLLLCARNPGCRITGIELDETAHEAALENIRRNDLSGRMRSLRADLRQLPEEITPGSFHCCISNPPYFTGGPVSSRLPNARQELRCSPQDLFRTAAQAVKFGGDLFLVHKPERLAQLIACGAGFGFEAKRLELVRHVEGGPVILILLSFRKGGKPGLSLSENCLFHSQGVPTAHYREVYHM